MTNSLVSVLTACYNCTTFVHRLLDSILDQDYPNIEMILVDDGSNDNLLHFLASNSYFEKFENRGYQLFYYLQKNMGQASAIKNGLNKIKGDYLIWPDSDDFFNSNIVGTMITAFNNDSRIGIVRCYSNHLNEKLELQKTYQGMFNEKNEIGDIFLDCLFLTKNMYFGAGNYMVKTKALKSSLKSMNIFEHRLTGQNWQLILPTVFNYRIYTISLRLHNIVQFPASHSRLSKNVLKDIRTLLAHKNTLLHTLDNTQNLKIMYRIKLKNKTRYIYFKRILGKILIYLHLFK